MAGDYLYLNAGVMTEKNAVNTSGGAGDSGKVVKLNSSGQIDQTMLPATELKTMTASETLSAGDVVNVHDSTGAKIRKADATGGVAKKADGFILAGIASSASGIMYGEGIISGLSSLTIGGRYYLSTTPGAITLTAPSTAGQIVQYIGTALSATELLFQPTEPIVLV